MQIARTDQKARMLDLVGKMMELFCEGKRDPERVLEVLQVIKDEEYGLRRLLGVGLPASTPFLEMLTIGDLSREKLAEEVVKLAGKKDFLVSDEARDIMTRQEFVTASRPDSIPLGFIHVGGLGFHGRELPLGSEVFARLEQFYDYCPAETGPQVYRKQKHCRFRSVFMKPIKGSDGRFRIFDLHGNAEDYVLSADPLDSPSPWSWEQEVIVQFRR